MQIKDLEKNDKKLQFDLEESNPATANAIRRTAMREIPTLAVTEVDFFQNTSSMYDEFIAHRIGMTPLKTPDTYEYEEESSTVLALNVSGPGIIHASQFEPEDPAVEPIYPDTPIIKLTENQTLEIEAKAEMGKGKEHARHKPCYINYTTNTEEEAEEDPEKNFHFKIEAYNEKEPEELLKKSLEIIKNKANELKEQVKERE